MGFFEDVMTVYNYYKDPETDMEYWFRSVVDGVQWTRGKRHITVQNNALVQSKAESITIDYMRTYERRKPYLEHTEYLALPLSEAEKYWTLNEQDGMDLVIYGDATQEIGGGYRLSDLRRDYPCTGTVTEVRDNRNRPRLKHIKVMAV